MLQRRGLIVGTRALRRATLAFGAIFLVRLLCEAKAEMTQTADALPWASVGAGEVLTAFVLLQLHAAVVDALDGAQATHLGIDAEILNGKAHTLVKYAICVEVDRKYLTKNGIEPSLCVYLPRAQCDQANVVSERTLLNLVDELGQLGVCAAAVVNLETCCPTPITTLRV